MKTNELLKQLGFTESEIQSLEKEETNVSELAQSFKEKQKEVTQNDPDIIKNLQKQADGKARGSITSAIKNEFGLKDEDLKEWNAEESGAYKNLLKIAHGKLNSKSSEPIANLQQELQEANKQLQKFEQEVIPSLKEQAQKDIKRYRAELKITNKISEEQNLLIPSSIVDKNIKNEIFNQFDVDLNDNGEILIKTKDGLVPQNKEKTKNLTFDDILTDFITPYKRQSNAGNEPKNTIPEKETPNKYNLPGLEKANQNLKYLKEKSK
jgi:hypothetical protein